MRQPRTILMSLMLFLALSPCAGAAEPPTGRFTGEGLSVTLARSGNSYTGSATLAGKAFELRGTRDGDAGLRGTFTDSGTEYTWSATLSGEALTFETGGTGYHLARQAEIPANPLAKKPGPANPLAKPGSAVTGPDHSAPANIHADVGALKFTRLSVKDPGINNIEAVTMLIPEGWKADGGVQWFPDSSILANLLLTITDPKSGAQIQFLPIQNFTWIDNPVVPMRPGTNYMGNIVHQPIKSVPDFIRAFYASRTLPHLAEARQVSVEELPRIAEQVSQAYGGTAEIHAARVRYEYEQASAPWQEDIYVTLAFTSTQGFTIWSVPSAYAFRAPKADFAALEPRAAATIGSVRLSQDWYAGYMYVQQLFMKRMNQGIQNARAISDTITHNSEDIRRMFADSYKQQSESQDRISRRFSEYIRGVDTYTNPYDSRPVELPSGYQSAWVDAAGDYILSPQGGFDPNTSSAVEWRRMDQVK